MLTCLVSLTPFGEEFNAALLYSCHQHGKPWSILQGAYFSGRRPSCFERYDYQFHGSVTLSLILRHRLCYPAFIKAFDLLRFGWVESRYRRSHERGRRVKGEPQVEVWSHYQAVSFWLSGG